MFDQLTGYSKFQTGPFECWTGDGYCPLVNLVSKVVIEYRLSRGLSLILIVHLNTLSSSVILDLEIQVPRGTKIPKIIF